MNHFPCESIIQKSWIISNAERCKSKRTINVIWVTNQMVDLDIHSTSKLHQISVQLEIVVQVSLEISSIQSLEKYYKER